MLKSSKAAMFSSLFLSNVGVLVVVVFVMQENASVLISDVRVCYGCRVDSTEIP
jgi:hypothetical protein